MNEKHSAVTLPWYRYRWPWILMAGPFVVVVAGVITVWLAIRSNDGLVADDYYKQGLAVNQMTARDQNAARLGWQAEVMAGEGGMLRAVLRGKAEAALPAVLVMRITHPTRAGVDQVVNLRSDGAGTYAGKLGNPLTGRWHIALEDEKREWRLTGEWVIEKSPVLRLPY